MVELSITIGTAEIGFIRSKGSRHPWVAFGPDGKPLGTFVTQEKARVAAWEAYQQRVAGGADASAS